MGVDARQGEAASAADVTAAHLREEHAEESVYLVGSDSLAEILQESEESRSPTTRSAPTSSSRRGQRRSPTVNGNLQAALDGLDDETAFLATDPDRTYPVGDDQFVPGTGAISGALAAAADRKPDRVLGKPSPTALEYAPRTDRGTAGGGLIVGDRLNTELAMGHRAGMATVLVLTGVCDWSDVDGVAFEPDYVVDSLAAIGTVLDDLSD